MTEPLYPEHIEELVAGYVLGDLSPEEAEEFKQLIAENPQLVTEANSLQEVLELLPYALPEVTPPLRLREAILEAAHAPTNPEPISNRFSLPWSKIVAGAAALLALVLGLDNYRLRQQLVTLQVQKDTIERLQQQLSIVQAEKDTVEVLLQQPNTRLFTLTGAGTTQTASGSIVVNVDRQKALIAFQNLPAPPAGQIYRLWAVTDNKKIACTEFSATQQGKVSGEFSIPASACSSTKSTLAVTLEPSALPPEPVGPIVMVESTL